MAITDLINCDCTDATGYRTLAQLRSDVMAACGFIDPFARTGNRTRAQLREEMRDSLGLADPITTAQTRTLVDMRGEVHRMLGFTSTAARHAGTRTRAEMRDEMKDLLGLADPITSAQTRTLSDMRMEVHQMLGFAAFGGNYAPGVSALIDDWLNEAQSLLWRRIELDKGGIAIPARMTADSDTSTLDNTPIIMMAVALAKAHYGQPDAKLYLDTTERYLSDWAARSPPGLDDLLTESLVSSHDAAVRRMESIDGATITSSLASDATIPTIDNQPIVLIAMAMVRANIGGKDAPLRAEAVEKYFAEFEKSSPLSAHPGIAALIDDWINESQAILWRRIELDKGGVALPPRMVADSDLSTLDNTPIIMQATAFGKAHYGKPDAKAYFDATEKYLVDWAARSPPGLDALLNAALSQANDTVVRRIEGQGDGTGLTPSGSFDQDSDIPNVDDHAILMLALSSMKFKIGQTDAKMHMEMWNRYMDDMERRMPPNARLVVNAALKSANRTMYMRHNALRTERYFSWPMVAGTATYGLDANVEVCTKKLNALKVTWVGIEDDGGSWRALRAGIPPRLHGPAQTGAPERYEIRSCIEVWPVPTTPLGYLVVKGHFGIEVFAADTDTPTVDDELVFLLAVANTKATFKQQDAVNYSAMAETHLRKLVAGTHTTNRYVPHNGDEVLTAYVQPKYIGPGAW